MIKFCPGFIAKKEIRDLPYIGPVSVELGCLFVNRESQESRKKIVYII